MAYKVIGMLANGGLGKDLSGSQDVSYKSQLENRGQNVVPYMSESEREQYRVSVFNKLIVDRDKVAFDTSDSSNKVYIFVMTADGKIYSADKTKVHHHSSFMAGRPVAAAGCWTVKWGKVTYINNQSGHYCPPKDFLEQFEKELKYRGADVSKIERQFGRSVADIERAAKARYSPLQVVIDYVPQAKDAKPIKRGEHYAGQTLRLYTPDPPRWEWF